MTRVVPLMVAFLVLPGAAWAGFWETDRLSAYSAWCVEQGGDNNYRNCGYPTLWACRAAASGAGGNCYPNPQYRPEIAEPRRKWRNPRLQ
ncbi:MAG: DUF3551 domain-containing protein [Xanthobacteraceae bacterium]|nr:DUF3551 domain-containing protein [Xanthobacteraceae bacterium]